MKIIEIAHAGVISDAPSISTVGINILNFLLQVAGIIAIISLVLAGMVYALSAGDTKRAALAKHAVQASIVGIIMAMSGMIVVRFIGQFFN